ncbi:MAG: hypothetical protein Q9M48_02570 [Rhodobacterales bacterium]|nr:hypothetical protein [Rhodobacterales bacterium]
MKRVGVFLWLVILALPTGVLAQDRNVILGVNPGVMESGILTYILPRFSLKTGITVSTIIVDNQEVTLKGADVSLGTTKGAQGAVVMEGNGEGNRRKYFVSQQTTNGAATRFVDWVLSDIGQRAIEAFKGKDCTGFRGLAGTETRVEVPVFDGDVTRGEGLSLRYCGRCHVIGAANRMKGLGSTPSFPLLRTFPDWQRRFEAFFTLRPHPSFSQIEGVTEPFDPALPSPIFPLRITLEQLDDILAYVAKIPPADLGAPLQTQ